MNIHSLKIYLALILFSLLLINSKSNAQVITEKCHQLPIHFYCESSKCITTNPDVMQLHVSAVDSDFIGSIYVNDSMFAFSLDPKFYIYSGNNSYTIRINDSIHQCFYDTSFYISVSIIAQPKIQLIKPANALFCYTDSILIFNINNQNGSPFHFYFGNKNESKTIYPNYASSFYSFNTNSISTWGYDTLIVEITDTSHVCANKTDTAILQFIPKAQAAFKASSGAFPNIVNFKDYTPDSALIIKRNWLFGDGSSNNKNQLSVSHTYKNGNFNCSLIVSDIYGCTDTAFKRININSNSIKEQKKILLEVFPNPCQNEILIRGMTGNTYSYSIYDSKQQCTLSGNLNQIHPFIDLSNINSGIYFIFISGEKETYNIKFFKE